MSEILVGKNRPLDRSRVVGDAKILHNREGEFALLQPLATPPDRAGVGGAVGRTMAVLRALIRLGPGEHPLTSVAESAGLPAATAHRYLQALMREGAVEQVGPRAGYALTDALHDPSSSTPAQPLQAGPPSPAVRAEIVTLQSRTGQLAFVFRPHLIGTPMRICVERAYGPHTDEVLTSPQIALRSLESAPLEDDAAGLAIFACLGSVGGNKIDIAQIREEGHAIGPSPLAGRTMIAAPVWYGSAVAGSVALLAKDAPMRRAATRARYVTAVMDTAAAMSGHLTRSGTRRAS
ncbi:helix-turn-helix domain-containing protein [Streptomyces lavenduligriseus]|uniref:Helix-turn-helix domain-containing protein n=1 Tax=Streptomyces lavenduligriseus TaxID=67315 RepID=A0ABT0P6Q6_9ACTN|nr:helix-turn-helix domain-containing protein [Streptomyces lavenduligriseus]MCL3999056.1 helix-turn-helix domain-containing protein [Streptomyces lavenduligriseus]